MKKSTWQRVTVALLAAVMLVSMAGCGGGSGDGDVIEFTMFAAMPAPEINDDNEIMNLIAEKTGVKVKETWLTGQSAAEAIGTIIAGGDYPDFIDGNEAMMALYDEGVLVPWDDYLEKYPNLKALFTDKEWDSLRQADGKIYWVNQFQNTYGESRATTHNDEAFWIQARVLEWAGYPKIETLDEYFDVLTSYAEANPTMADGTKIIPYTMLCEDWRYFCIENAPQFLDGYPNDGSHRGQGEPENRGLQHHAHRQEILRQAQRGVQEGHNRRRVCHPDLRRVHREAVHRRSPGYVRPVVGFLRDRQ